MDIEEKQQALDKCRDIALAAIEYNIHKQSGLLKPEEFAYYRNFHAVWKEQVEKQYREKELEKLKKLLQNLTVVYKMSGDIDFVDHVREKTGHDYDLFGNIYERMDKIITRKKIANRKERNEVSTMIELYRRTSIGQENAAVLLNLAIEFDNLAATGESSDSKPHL